MADDAKAIGDGFGRAVNMTATELSRWLETAELKAAGQKEKGGDGESTGHASGRRIVEIVGSKQGDRSADDLAHMTKVVGYVHRHLAQRPEGEVADSRWRHSLMNWGHDPLKERRRRGPAAATARVG